MRCTITDLERVNRVMRHPSVYDWISDDGSPGAGQYTAEPFLILSSCYVLAPDENSIFIYAPVNSITWEVHSQVLPESRGRSSDLAMMTLGYMFTKTPCGKVITWVPLFNMPALHLALSVGMRVEGCSQGSFMKRGISHAQYLLGIGKEDFLCQQQQS